MTGQPGFRVSSSTNDDRIVALDGLRAAAVLAVVFEHGFVWSPRAPFFVFQLWWPAQAGVRLFFVLSGFLITRVLLEARSDADAGLVGRGHVFRVFYVRRALRIFPLAYTAMLVAWILAVPGMRHHAAWYVSYLVNIGFVFFHTGDGVDLLGLGHFWSLAVEEQFYLVWPLLVVLLPRRYVTRTLWLTIILACCARMAIVRLGSFDAAYCLTPCRLDALGFGALAATTPLRPSRLLLAGAALATLGWLLPVGAVWAGVNESAGVVLSTAAVVAVAGGYGPSLLAWRPIRYLGRISYGIYVWHFLIFSLIFLHPALERWLRLPFDDGPARMVLPLLLWSVGLASLSWFVLERPLNALKRFFPYRLPIRDIGNRHVPAVDPRTAAGSPPVS